MINFKKMFPPTPEMPSPPAFPMKHLYEPWWISVSHWGLFPWPNVQGEGHASWVSL